jgi:hypothetical protein
MRASTSVQVGGAIGLALPATEREPAERGGRRAYGEA